jgi:magnesium transporter
LFGGALLTTFAMQNYDDNVRRFAWIAWFVPLVISAGGNSGSQSATLMIRALTTKEITPQDWRRVIWRELFIGLLLGGCLSIFGYAIGCFMAPSATDALVLPLTIVLVVTCGTLVGSLLPLLFHRLGFDPALMSTPFIAGISDIVGIVLYMNVVGWLLNVEM